MPANKPLNEDKYICFSCNNWLVNWHSLQALNSNNPESPSSNSRTNNMEQQQQSKIAEQHKIISNNCRPVAFVRPCARLVTNEKIQPPVIVVAPTINTHSNSFVKKLTQKRNKIENRTQEFIQKCSDCNRTIIVRRRLKSLVMFKKHSPPVHKCGKCRNLQQKSNLISKINNNSKPLITTEHLVNYHQTTNTTNTTNILCQNQTYNQNNNYNNKNNNNGYLPKPTIDGKIVSKLRRLGTTLERENAENGLPPIMSPTKVKKPTTQWTRQLDSDEVLINFDATISEVLPSFAVAFQKPYLNVKRSLAYQMSMNIQANDENTDVIELYDGKEEAVEEVEHDNGKEVENEVLNYYLPQDMISLLPKGLNVRII